jgi:hypothetical protein
MPVLAQQVQEAPASTRSIARILGIPQEESGKCGTASVVIAYARWNELSAEKQGQLRRLLQRTEMQTSRLSPSKKFRIHYDTSTSNTPALIADGTAPRRLLNTYEQFIDSVAYYFDYAWKLEVDTLGYPAPPSDGVQGGGPEFDVYVEELGTDEFGRTSWNQSTDLIEDGARQRFSTYIEIDNDFLGFRTPGINGLRITAAHEFHHAIQVGDFGWWTTVPNFDRYFYELTSVWIEHVAFPGIHDYYFDLPNYFQRFRDGFGRSLSFNTSTFAGYERSVWAQFLAKRFGRDVMKNIWMGIRSTPALGSMTVTLTQYGTSLESEFALFSSWNFFTSDRADPQRYYDDGANFPRFTPNVSTTFSGLTTTVSGSAPPLSTQFYEIALSADTITAVVANVNVAGAQDPNSQQAEFKLNLSSGVFQSPYQKVTSGLGLTFSTSDSKQWRTLYLQSSTRGNANSSPKPSPNPVRLSQDEKLVLPMVGASNGPAEVYVLNSALELVFSRQYSLRESFGSTYVDVPTSDLRGEVPSGVYFVVAKCGDAEFKWKVAIIR